MPIPTDTFWNIKRLNWVFAISAILLTAVTAWSIMQDHEKSWRIEQRHGRVWDAALTEDKIDSLTTNEERQKQIAELDKQIAQADAEIQPHREQIRKLEEQVKALTSERLTREFALNNQKSNLTVMEGALQDAIAANDAPLVKKLTAQIQTPRKQVEDATEYLANKVVAPLEEAKQKLREETAKRDELEGKKKKLQSSVDSMRKKLNALQPKNIFAKISEEVRNAPLLDFVNPSEKVQQLVLPDVLTDVAFMKITTLDRCQTCHVNIGNKDFTVEKIVRYLEEQSAQAHHFVLAENPSTKTTGPAATASRPGPVGMPEFWQAWTVKVAPDTIKKQAGRINQVVAIVGKGATITLDGKPLTGFKYNPALNDAKAAPSTAPTSAPTSGPAIDAPTQNLVLVQLLTALYRFDPQKPVAVTSSSGKVKVEIAATADKAGATTARDVGMRYIEEIAKGLAAAVPAEQLRLINDRYRYALVDVVNPVRREQGYPPLDASPALLAHPRLDLYADPDSYHPADLAEKRLGVGCTSCHDGSGQETDFVLAAHVPREIMVDRDSGVPVPEALLPPKETEEEIDAKTMASMLTAVAPEEAVTPKGVSSLHFELEEHKNGNGHNGHGESSRPVAYVDPVTGKTRQAVTQMTYWKAKYEPEAPRNFELVYHEWDWPMRPPQYLQANCARCHSNVLDIKDEAPTLFQGRQLFAQLGCVNCHIMQSVPAEDMPKDATHLDAALVMSNNRVKVGPSLLSVTSKLSPEFINTWIWAPKAFRPSTKMPHFFMLENNSSDEEIRRTRQEARAITEYLVQTAEPLPPAHPMPPGAHGSAEAGKAVFNSIGCMACHVNLNDPQPEKRSNKPITLGEKWIVNDLVKARGLKKDEAEKTYDGMTYNERQVYVKERFETEPGATEVAKYSDGTPKPIFVHVGPELSGLGTKLLDHRKPEEARQWLFDWLKEPRHYSAYTIMPQLRLSDQQAIDLVEYLLAQTRKANKENDPWTGGLCEVDSQKQIELTSLFLRNKYSAQTALIKADDEAELTSLATTALARNTKTKEEEPAALEAAKAKVATLTKDQKRMVWLGKSLIANYSCMSCHAINGTEKLTSSCPDLSAEGEKQVSKLDYGYLDPHKADELPAAKPIPMVNGLCGEASKLAHEQLTGSVAKPVDAAWPIVEHDRASWITLKLKNTRVYDRAKALLDPNPSADDVLVKLGKPYDKLKMPTFYLNDTQVHQIVTFVLSARDKLISEKLSNRALTDQAKIIARGRELTHKFNCVSCHWIENNAPQIQQYYKSDELLEKAPPPIRGEGNKVQFSWLFNFFKNVINLRPLLYQHDGIRMPSFPATDDEWTAIIAYFNSVSKKEANELSFRVEPVKKYIEAEKKKAGTLPPPDKAWPGDDWYRRDEFELSKKKLDDWVVVTKNMSPVELDPTKNTAEELGKGYRRALFKAQFTIDLYNAPFPFSEDGQPTNISQDRYKLGEEFFNQMQCLSCHYLGDPDAPGAVKEPKAPNLSLAYQRLQRRWVRHWVQEPPVIQPGTKMPAFFSGLPVFNPSGQTWSEATGRPKDEIAFFNNRYGKTADDQANLVLDYLFAAGGRGVTSVQVPLDQLPHPPSATTQPAGEAAPATGETSPKGNPAMKSPASTQPAMQAKPEPVAPPKAPPRAPKVQPDSPMEKPSTAPATAPATNQVGFNWRNACIDANCDEYDPAYSLEDAVSPTVVSSACLS